MIPSSSLQRSGAITNKLAAADKTICYLTRGTFKEDQHDTGFTDTRWVELEELYEKCGGKAPLNRALKKYRDMRAGGCRCGNCRV